MVRYRLRPGLLVLDCGDGSIQVGTDPCCAKRLGDLSESEAAFLLSLGTGFSVVQSASAAGLTDQQTEALLIRLRNLGLVYCVDRSRPGIATPEQSQCLLQYGDEHALGLRSQSSVRVLGAGRLGALIALSLQQSGVRCVQLETFAELPTVDFSDGFPYPMSALGGSRQAAASDLMRTFAPPPRSLRGPEFTVLVTGGAIPSTVPQSLGLSSFLPVVVGELGVSVGPLIGPDRMTCLECMDRTRVDRDQSWRAMAPALQARFGDPQCSVTASALSLAAAGMASALVLDYLDGAGQFAPGSSVYVPAYSLQTLTTMWHPHPRCSSHGRLAA